MKPKYNQIIRSHTFLAAGLLTASFVVTPSVQASDWTGGNSTWSSNANPGWNGTDVPNAVGAVANHGVSTTSVTTVDSAVTVGTISLTNNSAFSWTITLTNVITLNQDSTGSGTATISNTNSNTGSSNFLAFKSGTLTLADNLLISNTGASTSSGGSIGFSSASVIAGTGNITIDNVLNPISNNGSIRFDNVINTFTGNVNLRSGVTSVHGGTPFGNTSNVITLGAASKGSASLVFTTGAIVFNPLVVAAGSGGTLTLGSNSGTTGIMELKGSVTLDGDLTINRLNSNAAGYISLQGVVSGTGSITKVGVGSARLASANTYSGITKVSDGILSLTNALALQNSAVDTTASVTGTATAGLVAGVTTLTLGGLTGNKNLADVFATGTAGGYGSVTALTLNPGTGVTRTYGAAITNGAAGMSLTKTGLGTQVLSATNTYTGATTVSVGTLVVDGSISTSTTTVQTGATLGGSGTVGGLTVNSGAFHTPGSSPGIQNTGNYSNAGTLAIEINGATVGTDYDQVNTTGTVSLSGMLSITMGYTPLNNALFFILANEGTDAISGTFTNVPDNGETFTLNGQKFVISYIGDSGNKTFTGGNDVVLLAVPEPRAALLGSLGMLMLLRRRR